MGVVSAGGAHSRPTGGLEAGDSPVVGLDGFGVSDVLGLVVQPAVRLHRILVSNLGWSILVPGGTGDWLETWSLTTQSLLASPVINQTSWHWLVTWSLTTTQLLVVSDLVTWY